MRIRRKTLLVFATPLVIVFLIAFGQRAIVGLPSLPACPLLTAETTVEPYGFPAWLRITHFVNFLFLILLIRSGLQILADHPRLYWNVHCTPGTEWLRITPIEVPTNRVWTAKDDSRYQRAATGTGNRLRQHGVKKPGDPPDKYVEAFAGGDIQTNPPATNEAVEKSQKNYACHVDQMPSPSIVSEIDRKVDMAEMERVLMNEGISKFVAPQRALLELIAQKRKSAAST